MDTTIKESWLEKGIKFITNYVWSEKDVVRDFLKTSENYQALKKIREASEASKNEIFAGFSIYPAFSQLDPFEEELIDQLKQAKTFAELLSLTRIPKDQPHDSYVETFLSVTGKILQRANGSYYMFQLANEIKKYAEENSYSLDYQQNIYATNA